MSEMSRAPSLAVDAESFELDVPHEVLEEGHIGHDRTQRVRILSQRNAGRSEHRNAGMEVEGYVVDGATLEPGDPSYLFRNSPLDRNAKLEEEHHKAIFEMSLRGGRSIPELETHFRTNLMRLVSAVRGRSQELLLMSLYPFGPLEFNDTNPDMKLWALRNGEAARRSATAGLHIHRDTPDLGYATRLYDLIRAQAPLLMTLASNSPVTIDGEYNGRVSERAANRAMNAEGGHARNLGFTTAKEFVLWLQEGLTSGRMDWPAPTSWDVRPPRLFAVDPSLNGEAALFTSGTVELTACDVSYEPEEWFMLIDFYHAMCAAHAIHDRDGIKLPPHLSSEGVGDDVVAENRKRAVRYGTQARLINGEGSERPVRELIEQWMAFMERVLQAPYTRQETRSQIGRVLEIGSPAERTMREYGRRTGQRVRSLTGTKLDPLVLRDILVEHSQALSGTVEPEQEQTTVS